MALGLEGPMRGPMGLEGGLADAEITATHPTECKGDSFQPEAYRQASSVN